MGDIEENEGAVDESSRLMERESSAGEVCVEMEPKTTAHYTDVSTTNTVSNKDLHNAVLSAYQSGKANGEIYRTELFMSQHLKVNMPNKSGYTAVSLAVNRHHKMYVELMLKHPSGHRLYLHYCPGDSEHTLREIIMQTYPDLQPLLPAPLMESLNSSERGIKLLAALQHDEYYIFRQNLNPTYPNPWYD
jgi:hypothetical protein